MARRGGVFAEVDVLQLGVEHGEDVEEPGQGVCLLHQGVLLDEQVLGEAAGTL